MSLESRIRAKESELTELALILLNLYDKGIVDRTRYLELSTNLMQSTTREVKTLVDRDASSKGLPPSDDEILAIALMLERIGQDLSTQIDDLNAGEHPEQVKLRVQQSVTYVIKTVQRETTKAIAKLTGAQVMWLTMQDPAVCEVCRPRHGVIYELSQVPPYPHPSCRCWLELVK